MLLCCSSHSTWPRHFIFYHFLFLSFFASSVSSIHAIYDIGGTIETTSFCMSITPIKSLAPAQSEAMDKYQLSQVIWIILHSSSILHKYGINFVLNGYPPHHPTFTLVNSQVLICPSYAEPYPILQNNAILKENPGNFAQQFVNR